jgi:hypothetical protein
VRRQLVRTSAPIFNSRSGRNNQVLVPQSHPNHPLADHRRDGMLTRAAFRPSLKQGANRSTKRIARSVALSSGAPASEITALPSNAAPTGWPSTVSNPNGTGYFTELFDADP